MLSKRNLILLALLCLQVVVIGVAYMSRPQGGPARLFFEGLEPSAVARLTVATPEGRSVTVARQEKGWVVETPARYPADRDKIENLLGRLATLRSDRLVAQTREAHNRFQVGASRFGQKVTLTLAAGGERILYVGSAPSITTAHVRAEGDDRVYLVRDLTGWQLTADEKFWWQREYLVVQPEEVQGITLVNRAGTIRLNRAGKEWQLAEAAGRPLDAARVEEFVAAVSRVALSDYLGQEAKREYGLEKPLATLTLTTKAGVVMLTVGAGREDGSHVLKSSASPFYVRGGGAGLSAIAGRAGGDLLAGAATGGE